MRNRSPLSRGLIFGLVVATVPLLGTGCGAMVELEGGGSVAVSTDYYSPQYYDGHIIYYVGGRPSYYVNGQIRYVSSSHPRYRVYVRHYRTNRVHYQRWYQDRGKRIRHARRVRARKRNKQRVRRGRKATHRPKAKRHSRGNKRRHQPRGRRGKQHRRR